MEIKFLDNGPVRVVWTTVINTLTSGVPENTKECSPTINLNSPLLGQLAALTRFFGMEHIRFRKVTTCWRYTNRYPVQYFSRFTQQKITNESLAQLAGLFLYRNFLAKSSARKWVYLCNNFKSLCPFIAATSTIFRPSRKIGILLLYQSIFIPSL